jgi:RND family efflux transporter MFP subunit
LLKDELVPESEYDAAEARYKSAQSSVEAAEANIRAMSAGVQVLEVAVENTYIRAPFDGTVLNKYADEGEMVAPFAAGANARASVLTIADMESLQVEADVSESNIEKVKIGLPCQIILDAYPEKAYHGVVHKIVPTADRSKATVLTKIRFTDRDNLVLPEMSAKVAFLSESYNTDNNNTSKLAVYSTAIVKRNDKQIAFKIMEKENKVEEITVETGSAIGDYLEIKNGLQLGDKVVLNPEKELANGSKVNIAQ